MSGAVQAMGLQIKEYSILACVGRESVGKAYLLPPMFEQEIASRCSKMVPGA